MAYEAARTLYKMALSDFSKSLGREPIAKGQVKEIRTLKTRYSPKGTDVPLYLPNLLRPFTSRKRAESLQDLPYQMVAALPKCGPVSTEERKARSDAFALKLAMEMPERSAILAGLTQAHLKVFEFSGQLMIAVYSNTEQTGQAIGQLSGEAVHLYLDLKSRVLDLRPNNPHLFVGRSGSAISPPGFRQRIVGVTKDQLQLKKGLSVRDLRWIIAFIHLASDANSRDLVASYLGHKKRKDIEPLLKLVEDWRRSGALASYTQQTVGGASDNDR